MMQQSKVLLVPHKRVSGGRSSTLRMYTQVDRKRCVGCGLCEMACPSWFHLDSTGTSCTLSTPVPPELRDMCQVVSDACPIDAIAIRKEQ